MKKRINHICAKLCNELGRDGYDYNYLLKDLPNENEIKINQCKRLIKFWENKIRVGKKDYWYNNPNQVNIMIESLQNQIKKLKQ